MTSQWLMPFTDLGWVSGYVLLIRNNGGSRTSWVTICHDGRFKQIDFASARGYQQVPSQWKPAPLRGTTICLCSWRMAVFATAASCVRHTDIYTLDSCSPTYPGSGLTEIQQGEWWPPGCYCSLLFSCKSSWHIWLLYRTKVPKQSLSRAEGKEAQEMLGIARKKSG